MLGRVPVKTITTCLFARGVNLNPEAHLRLKFGAQQRAPDLGIACSAPPVVPGSPKEEGHRHPLTKGGTLTAHASSPERETILCSFAWQWYKRGGVCAQVGGLDTERSGKDLSHCPSRSGPGESLLRPAQFYPFQLHQGALGFDCHGNGHSRLSTQNRQPQSSQTCSYM